MGVRTRGLDIAVKRVQFDQETWNALDCSPGTKNQLFPPVRAISPASANSSIRQHRSTIERA